MKRVVPAFFARATGQALDRVGLTVSGTELFKETYASHRPIMNLFDKRPLVANGVFVAPSASVIGEVLLYGDSSVWYGAVLRGDKNKIQIGSYTNIQDRAVISTVNELSSGFPAECKVGDYTTVGHGAMLTSCLVGDHCSIGAGAIVQEGSVVEKKSMVAPGAVVTSGTLIPSGQLWAGNPAKFIRDLSEDEIGDLEKSAMTYSLLAKEHQEEFLPFGTVYQAAENH